MMAKCHQCLGGEATEIIFKSTAQVMGTMSKRSMIRTISPMAMRLRSTTSTSAWVKFSNQRLIIHHSSPLEQILGVSLISKPTKWRIISSAWILLRIRHDHLPIYQTRICSTAAHPYFIKVEILTRRAAIVVWCSSVPRWIRMVLILQNF